MFWKRKTAGPVEWLIAGLGNPGRTYEQTRHNAGFMSIDCLARERNVAIDRSKFHSLTARTEIEGTPVLLLKPQTMMNGSGLAVQEAAMFYKLPPERIVILVDDIHLPLGALRVRQRGSAGGQNGLKDIIACLASENFPRVRIGVGQKPYPEYDLVRWVLSRFSPEEMAVMKPVFENAAKAASLIAQGQIERAMNLYSRK